MMDTHHSPVLFNESLDFLVTAPDGIYFDGTLGFGGHSEGILKRLNTNGTLVATDIDKDAFGYSTNKFSSDNRVKLYNFNFSQIDIVSKIESIKFFDGIFADLGVSSFQLDTPESGFTYRQEAKLDLRMDKTKVVNAADVINSFEEHDLADIIYKFGEEKNSRKIARTIVQRRASKRIETTSDLNQIIFDLTPKNYQVKTLSRVYQAFRIFVNDELNVLKSFLDSAVGLLKPGGRIVIISYHSLEDRIVKDTFKYETIDCICPKDYPVCQCGKERRLKILTKKPVVPAEEEVRRNFRSRSAKLRAAERL